MNSFKDNIVNIKNVEIHSRKQTEFTQLKKNCKE